MSISSIKSQIQFLVASFRAKAQDGLTWIELQLLVDEFTAAVMAIVAVTNLPGVEKKKMVLEAIGLLCDTLLPFIPLYGFGMFIRPWLKLVIVNGASSLIEHIYADKFK